MIFRTSSLFFLIISIGLCSYGQRPMSRELIHSKLDSIQNEADFIYNHKRIVELTSEKLELEIKNENFIIYGLDTLTLVIVGNDNYPFYQARYTRNLKFVDQQAESKALSKEERLLFLLKRKLIDMNLTAKHSLPDSEGFTVFQTLFYAETGYRFFSLSESNEMDSIVFGNSALFYTDQLGDIVSYDLFHKEKTGRISKLDNRGNPKTGFTYVYGEERFIFSSDIVAFRLFKRPKELTSFSVYSRSNKTNFKYDAVENKITLGF